MTVVETLIEHYDIGRDRKKVLTEMLQLIQPTTTEQKGMTRDQVAAIVPWVAWEPQGNRSQAPEKYTLYLPLRSVQQSHRFALIEAMNAAEFPAFSGEAPVGYIERQMSEWIGVIENEMV